MKKSTLAIKSIAAASVLLISACASMTPTREVTEGYRIYDVKGSSSHGALSSNLKTAMQENADSVKFSNNLPPHPLPDKPGRFELMNPYEGTNIGKLMAAQGKSVKVPQCENALISATSNDNFQGAENTTFFVCLMPYTQGYHMNVYYTFTKVSGGFTPKALGSQLASSVMGDSSQFIPRTIAALETAITDTGASIAVVEAYP